MKQILIYLFNNLIMFLMVFLLIMLSVAFFTLFERKILSYMHTRKGPNKISMFGLIQPFSDAMKLLTKEFFYPKKSNLMFYLISPLIMFFLTMSMWMTYPFFSNTWSWNFSCLFLLCLMNSSIYGLMMSGWSSNSSFSLLGSIRSIAQSISYEVIFSIAFLLPFLLMNSINFMNLMIYNKYIYLIFTFWPSMFILFMSMMAEINRTPFDLSEGESELVSGFNIEYSNHNFTLIFLAEYSNIMFMMFIFSLMNFNMNFNFLMYFFTINLTFIIIWMRASLPRIRYDFLMYFCWFYLLTYILMIYLMFLIFLKMPIQIYLMF